MTHLKISIAHHAYTSLHTMLILHTMLYCTPCLKLLLSKTKGKNPGQNP